MSRASVQLAQLLAGVGAVKTAIALLNNNQIKNSPTAQVKLVPSPTGKILIPLFALWECNVAAGIYTNIDANASLTVTDLAPVSEGYDGTVTQLLTGGQGDPTYASSIGSCIVGGQVLDAETGFVKGGSYAWLSSTPYNDGIYFGAGNGESGNFTGGHADNWLKILLMYLQLDVATA